MDITKQLENEFSLKAWQAENTVKLLDDGNTVPFIARYRKEATGSLDDRVLRTFSQRLNYLRNFEEQKAKIIDSITQQGLMDDKILLSIDNAVTVTELDDIYRPFKPKRKTRASDAVEKGLEPLSKLIYSQNSSVNPKREAQKFITDEVKSVDEAMQGARDIIAQIVSDDATGRKILRYSIRNNAVLTVKALKDDLGVYEMYRDYSEPIKKIASHRILAINRGEKEGYLKVSIDYDKSIALGTLYDLHCKNGSKSAEEVKKAVDDSYTRLLFPSIEREIRGMLTDSASEHAISVFSENTRNLLMQPPVKGRVTIGLDPGYRTGCKVAVVDETGKVLDTTVIYPAPPHNKIAEARKIIKKLVRKYGVTMFAIGNGTASHETEVFAADLIKELDCGIEYMVVSEAGASVYSASELADAEFPQFDVSLRSAVSISRRLQDPLSELVKIDPKSIGVGQYQHDIQQKQLNEALDAVVEDCVNSVGVDLNTASVPLLRRISGITPTVAQNIVNYRENNGKFKSRSELKNVSKLGAKAFEQCAGFLRVNDGENVLDSTAVHPESYESAKKLLKICSLNESDVRNGKAKNIGSIVRTIGTCALAEEIGIGIPTLNDIVKELEKPGRDPRDELPATLLRKDIMSIDDLKSGMQLKGTVRNVTDFGAFIDIGVHEDGLVHISKISNKFIRHPSEVLKVGDTVDVWVENVDTVRNRISLTMMKP